MPSLQDRRVQIAVATVVVLLIALLLLTYCVAGRRRGDTPPAGPRGSLQVQVGKEDAKLDPARPLRCFVNGQFVGEETLIDCAKKNGVAAQNLDVGLDQTGQVAAAQTGGQTALTPIPQSQPDAIGDLLGKRPDKATAPSVPTASSAPTAQCLRFAGGEWRETGANVTLQACTRALYDGRCVRAGDALYGRFGAQTLRLVPGRVEISNDNRNFRPLQEQSEDCSLS